MGRAGRPTVTGPDRALPGVSRGVSLPQPGFGPGGAGGLGALPEGRRWPGWVFPGGQAVQRRTGPDGGLGYGDGVSLTGMDGPGWRSTVRRSGGCPGCAAGDRDAWVGGGNPMRAGRPLKWRSPGLRSGTFGRWGGRTCRGVKRRLAEGPRAHVGASGSGRPGRPAGFERGGWDWGCCWRRLLESGLGRSGPDARGVEIVPQRRLRGRSQSEDERARFTRFASSGGAGCWAGPALGELNRESRLRAIDGGRVFHVEHRRLVPSWPGAGFGAVGPGRSKRMGAGASRLVGAVAVRHRQFES